MSLLEQDNTRKGRVDDENVELDAGDKKGEYEMKANWDSKVYTRESESGHLSVFTIWFHGKDIRRKRILGKQPQ